MCDPEEIELLVSQRAGWPDTEIVRTIVVHQRRDSVRLVGTTRTRTAVGLLMLFEDFQQRYTTWTNIPVAGAVSQRTVSSCASGTLSTAGCYIYNINPSPPIQHAFNAIAALIYEYTISLALVCATAACICAHSRIKHSL